MKIRLFSALLVSGLLGAVTAQAAPDHAEVVTEVESCEAILRTFMAVPATAIPASVLKSARGLLITNQFKAGFIFGVKGGYGVVMVRQPSGKWSLPVIVHANEASFGLQAGAKSIETVYVFTNDAAPKLLFKERIDLGVDAKAVAGPREAEVEKYARPLVAAPVLVYTKAAGFFAGATVKAAQIAHDDSANFVLYNTRYTLPELLYSDWVPPTPDVQPLIQFVTQITQ